MNKMRSVLLSLTLLSIISIQADTVTYYTYRSELTLGFLEHGVNGFLDLAKMVDLKHFQYALEDIIDLAKKNGTIIPKSLDNTIKKLSHRIEKIQYLQDKSIDRELIIRGSLFVFITFACWYGLSYFYKTKYRTNKDKYDSLIQELNDQGITIKHTARTMDYTINDVENSSEYSYSKIMQAFNVHVDKQDTINSLFFGGMISLLFLGFGIHDIYNGIFLAHQDDQYLNKYQAFLKIAQSYQLSYPLKPETYLSTMKYWLSRIFNNGIYRY